MSYLISNEVMSVHFNLLPLISLIISAGGLPSVLDSLLYVTQNPSHLIPAFMKGWIKIGPMLEHCLKNQNKKRIITEIINEPNCVLCERTHTLTHISKMLMLVN